MTTTTKLTYAATMERYGLISCDFTYNCHDGIEYCVYATGSEPDTATAVTPLFDYNNDEHHEDMKEICLAVTNSVVDLGVNNIEEVSGSFFVNDGQITFEGQAITLLTGICTTIS